MKKIFDKKYLPLFLINFIIIISSNLTIDPVLLPRFTILAVFILFLAVYVLISNKSSFQVNLFLILFVIYLVYSAITILYSVNKTDGIFDFLKIFLFFSIIFFFSIFYKNTENFIEIFTRSISLISLLIIIIGIFQLFFIENKIGFSHQNMYQINSVFANKNIFSEILLLLLPYSIYNILFEKKSFKIISFINFIFILFFIIILLSRAIWISLVFSIVISIVFLIIFTKNKLNTIFKSSIINKKSLLFAFMTFAIIAFSIYFYSKEDSFKTFKKQTITFVNINRIKKEDRIQLWQKTVLVIKEAPLFGKGLASWKIEFLKYGNKNLHSENNTTFYQRPHNDYLWILAEQGIIGLVIYLALFIILLIYSSKIINQIKDKKIKTFFILNIWAFFAFLLISTFSFPRERIEHNILLSLIASFTTIYYNKTKTTKNHFFTQKQIKTACFFIIPIVIFTVFVGIKRINGEFYVKKAFEARANNNYKKTIENIDEANSLFYKIDPFSTPIIWYKGEANFYLNNTKNAFNNFKTAYSINPYHIHVLNNLATCYTLKGNTTSAIKLYSNAIKISNNFDEALLNISAIYYNMGEIDSAFWYFNQVDTASINPMYQQFSYPILKSKISSISSNITDETQNDIINKIFLSEIWTKDIYLKSKKNNITFEKQLLLDVEFIKNN